MSGAYFALIGIPLLIIGAAIAIFVISGKKKS